MLEQSRLALVIHCAVSHKCYLNPLGLSLMAAKTIGASESCRGETVFKKDLQQNRCENVFAAQLLSPSAELLNL